MSLEIPSAGAGDEHDGRSVDLESQTAHDCDDLPAGGKPGGSSPSSSSRRRRWRSIYIILVASKEFISVVKEGRLDGFSPLSTQPRTINTGISSSSSDPDNIIREHRRDIIESRIESTVTASTTRGAANVERRNKELQKRNKELQNATIAGIVKAKDLKSLNDWGGVSLFAEALDVDLKKGLPVDGDDFCCRHITITCSPPSDTHARPQGEAGSFFHILSTSCNKYIICLLVLCALLSLIIGVQEEGPETGWFEGVCLMFAIFALVAIAVIRKYWILWNLAAACRKKDTEISIQVFRGGSEQQISISNVVLGDIVCLEAGDQIPADGLFIRGESLEVDEEESIIDDQNPFLFYGSKVIKGSGRMLVTAVGNDTRLGEMRSNVTNAPHKKTPPLQVQVDRLNTGTQITGLLVAIIILVVLLLRYHFEKQSNGTQSPDPKAKPASIREFISAIQKAAMKPRGKTSILITTLTVFLVGIAEGLPLTVTLAIGYLNKKALPSMATAQDFLACLSMGSVTTICTDKTCGAAALNQMEFEMLYIGEEVIEEEFDIAPDVHEALSNGIGTSMEDPLITWASKTLGLNVDVLTQQCDIVEAKSLYSDGEEYRAILMRRNERLSTHCKGPAPKILGMCSDYYDRHGTKKAINDQERKNFERIIADMQSNDLKAIAFGFKQSDAQLEETDLVLVGLVGLKYSFKRAIKACIEGGVKLKLISGCNVPELRSIALQCGMAIHSSDSEVSAEDFRNAKREEMEEMAERVCVMGNSRPSDRQLLVKCLKQKGEVVVMVGGGINEMLAISEADVGITMGKFGSDAARQSSSIICSEGDFTLLVTIMMYGRFMCENIQKLIRVELTMIIAWSLISIIMTACPPSTSLASIQFFWVSFTVAVPVGLALLLMEPPTEEQLKKSPVTKFKWVITGTTWRNIVFQALYQVAIMVTFQVKGRAILGTSEGVHKTMIFSIFVLCQLFIWFTARDIESKSVFKGLIHRNPRRLLTAVALTIVLQEAYTEIAHLVGNANARLNIVQWVVCFSIGVFYWAIDWAGKCAEDFIAICSRQHWSNKGSTGMTTSDLSESFTNLEPLV